MQVKSQCSRPRSSVFCYAIWVVAFLVLALLLVAPAALAEEPEGFEVTPGLTAHWFDPQRSGEGLVLEILDADSAVVYWFTYDEDGNQRWLLDVGEIVGDQIVFSELTVTHGGQFGPDFDPDEVEYEVAGEAVLKFSDCNSAEFSYTAFGQSATRQMVRLTQTMAAGCQPAHGVPGQPVREYAGQSGSWFDLDHAGEGYTLQWLSHDEAVLIWFTYDPEGNQYWMTGLGRHEDGRIEFETLFTTTGASFGEAFDADDVEYSEWGSLSLEIECLGGTAEYQSELPEFGSGDFDLTRLSQVARPDCPYQAPSFTDLFEVSYEELELEPDTFTNNNNLNVRDMADDGTLLAFERWSNELRLYDPETGEWEVLQEEVATGAEAFLSSDGTQALVTERIRASEPYNPLMWHKEEGWQELSGLVMEKAVAWGVSRNFKYVSGRGRFVDESGQTPFFWDEEHGQRELPTTEEIPTGMPVAISNDGRVVVGFITIPRQNNPPTTRALRWIDEGEPEVPVDDLGYELGLLAVCSTNCEVIFGFSQFERDPDHPHYRQPFYLTESGAFQYLGGMDDAIEFVGIHPYSIADATADGTIAVGVYVIEIAPQRLGSDGLIWTQATGLVSLRQLFAELEISDDDWSSLGAMRLSDSGDRILVLGDRRESTNNRTDRRVAILTITPRDAE